MPNRYIYVDNGGSQDPSRWLHISARRSGECVLHLQDLCHPGKLSHLTSVGCPLSFVKAAVDHGPLQVTTGSGYLLLRRSGDLMQIEFRGLDDGTATKVSVRMDDFSTQLDAVASQVEAAQTAKAGV